MGNSMALSFEKIKMLEKHAAVMGPLTKLFNDRYTSLMPDVERNDHPQHYMMVSTINKMTEIADTLLRMLQEGYL